MTPSEAPGYVLMRADPLSVFAGASAWYVVGGIGTPLGLGLARPAGCAAMRVRGDTGYSGDTEYTSTTAAATASTARSTSAIRRGDGRRPARYPGPPASTSSLTEPGPSGSAGCSSGGGAISRYSAVGASMSRRAAGGPGSGTHGPTRKRSARSMPHD